MFQADECRFRWSPSIGSALRLFHTFFGPFARKLEVPLTKAGPSMRSLADMQRFCGDCQGKLDSGIFELSRLKYAEFGGFASVLWVLAEISQI